VNYIDAAVAQSSTDLLDNSTLPDGYGKPSSVPRDASIGLDVQKYGRTTGMTHGQVAKINVTLDVCYEAIGLFCLKSARFVDQIASMLDVSPKTIEFHRHNIRKKLGVKSNLRGYLATTHFPDIL
jgi:hypothetical protein